MARAKGAAKGGSAKKRKRAKPKRPRCEGKTKAGKRCANRARKGSKYCGAHGEKAGRKSSFEPAIGAAITAWMEQGAYAKVAAEAVGISESTLYRWLEEGEADHLAERDTDLCKFWESYRDATSRGELALLAQVRKAAEKDGRLALEMLARRHPDRWSKRKRLEHSGIDGGPIKHESAIDPDKLTVAERRQLLELHEKATAKPENKGAP